MVFKKIFNDRYFGKSKFSDFFPSHFQNFKGEKIKKTPLKDLNFFIDLLNLTYIRYLSRFHSWSVQLLLESKWRGVRGH